MFLRRVSSRFFSSVIKPRNKAKFEIDSLKKVFSLKVEDIEWQSIRDDVTANSKRVNAANLDGIILGICNHERRLDVARSYIDFLKSQSIEINEASISQLLRMFYNQNEQNEELELSSEDEDQIIKFSQTLIEKHEILGPSLAENLIHGLSLTSKWRDCLEIFDRIKEHYSPNKSIYSCIISKALKENDLETVWKLLDEMFAKQLPPTVPVLLRYFRKFQTDVVMTEKMLRAFSDNNFMLPQESIKDFIKVFRNCKVVNIVNNGNCSSCSNNLPSAKLNEREFNHLSNTFLNKALLRNDVFLQTNPEELRKFKNFVERTIPYDCVIDGLNVAYSLGNKLNVETLAHNVASVVKYFVDRRQTCLVIGRKHMTKWPVEKMNYIKKNSSFFLADNLSKDDPFLLYAALKSGPETMIFSRDLMRGHSHLLDFESHKLFRRWQKQHQYSSFNVVQRNIHVDEPIAFELRSHKVGNFWHIPFTSENLNFTYETFEMPTSWLCIEIETK